MGRSIKIALATAVTIIAIIIIVIIIFKNAESPDTAGIIPGKYPISKQDYWNSFNSTKKFAGSDTEAFFKRDVANKHTLDFFGFLQNRFRDMEYIEHMQAVRQYLLDTIHPPEKAEEMYKLYGKYNEYQKELYNDQGRIVKSGTPKEMLEGLREIQEFRRRYFGRENADAIFGVEVKSNEYALRKQLIIGEAGLTGKEKEERLASLRREMWGDRSETINERQEPLDRFREKMKIYEADLARMDEGERENMVRKLRLEIFSPEEVERMENADRQLKFIKQRDREYSRQSREILDNTELSEQEKNRKIRQLHERIFSGSSATAR